MWLYSRNSLNKEVYTSRYVELVHQLGYFMFYSSGIFCMDLLWRQMMVVCPFKGLGWKALTQCLLHPWTKGEQDVTKCLWQEYEHWYIPNFAYTVLLSRDSWISLYLLLKKNRNCIYTESFKSQRLCFACIISFNPQNNPLRKCYFHSYLMNEAIRHKAIN